MRGRAGAVKEKEVDVMSTMKPIQATPELRGKGAVNLLAQTKTEPTKQVMKKNVPAY